MIRELFGLLVGVYIAQTYDIPNLECTIHELGNTLLKYRKRP